MKNTKLRYLVNFAALALMFAAVATMSLLGGNTVKLKITPSIWQCSYLIIMAASLNLVLGFLGQLSLGHCGFMAVGAYTAALISLAFQRAGVYTEKYGPGNFVDTSGKRLGEHKGYPNYTIGQRKGLGINRGFSKRLYGNS